MMESYVTEEQQIEAIKKLWKEYGLSVILGLSLAVVVGFGWNYYRSYKTKKAEEASLIYESLLMDSMDNKVNNLTRKANLLVEKFSSTPYAKLATLILAKQAVNNNQLDTAEKQLSFAMKHSFSKSFKQITRIRLARVYLAKDDFSQALHVLDKIDDQNFEGLVSETKGDIYSKMKQTENAHDAYEHALNLLPDRPLLQMKLDNSYFNRHPAI